MCSILIRRNQTLNLDKVNNHRTYITVIQSEILDFLGSLPYSQQQWGLKNSQPAVRTKQALRPCETVDPNGWGWILPGHITICTFHSFIDSHSWLSILLFACNRTPLLSICKVSHLNFSWGNKMGMVAIWNFAFHWSHFFPLSKPNQGFSYQICC